MIRRSFLAGATLMGVVMALPATAAPGFTDYKPGMVKKALAEGKTVFLDYAADWCGTCRRQEKIIGDLIKQNPKYKSSMKFIRVDWDDFKNADIRKDYQVPRRSTLIVLKGNKELGRLVAVTSENAIKDLMNKGL